MYNVQQSPVCERLKNDCIIINRYKGAEYVLKHFQRAYVNLQ